MADTENTAPDAGSETPTPQEDTATETVAVADTPQAAGGGEVVTPQPELSESMSALPSVEAEAAPRKEVPGGREYEIIYIARTGDPAGLDTTVERARNLIEQAGGAVDNTRISEVRRLAYPIGKQTEGIYVVLNARFTKDLTTELDRFFKLEESVLRHMVLRDED